MTTPTYNDVLAAKQIPLDELVKEYAKLKAYKPKDDKRCFAGNPILYHYQLDNLCRVKTKQGSFYEMMMNDEEREKWWIKINKYACGSRPDAPAMRLFEIYRRMTGAVVFFKPTVAINIYSYCKPTHVLDPCAGWGGRLLGAAVYGCGYTGIDMNTDLKPSYDKMMEELEITADMRWGDALAVDFGEIDYDCVLTSPPYINLELYPHMTAFESKKAYYDDFLKPLISKCRASIRREGKVCFNISPAMYKDLIASGYDECKEDMPMLQQKVRGKDKADRIYIW